MTMIENYYIGRYGIPERETEFVSPEGNKVEIYKWSKEQTDEEVTMYATLGASRWLGDEKVGCEFFIGMSPEVDDVVQVLAETALHENGTTDVPPSGDAINLTYPLWRGTQARSFMFTDGKEIMSPLQISDKEIEFIQLVPLFDSELPFK